ncbi:MAG: hypothetical protein IKD70_02820, partial [Eggerthellaceae bacterium]|nr:hypothetical protein [Eggerthellaceae bacterium]
VARAAHVSRSTLYQHYAHTREIYDELVSDFNAEVSPAMTQMACFEGIAEEGTQPFCEICRHSEKYRALIDSPCFVDTYVASLKGNPTFMEHLAAAGVSEEMAVALATFQINGCFKAVKHYGSDDAKWREVRAHLDAFICGGISECAARTQAEQ